MLTAKDIMTINPFTLAPDADVSEAVRLMLENKINGLPVVDQQQQLVGVICQSDLVAQQKKVALPSFFTLLDGLFPVTASEEMDKEVDKMTALTVEKAMTTDPVHVNEDTPLDEIATLMVEKKLYTLPVVNEGRLVGVVGKEDVLRTLL
ncbi:CBS domain-containing protein [Paucidesulfovibrio gracilis DSM 16080]|uniref:CBS domain-containing protein n=1 Tax=Paucidesulfovibrio gracilis DSM 16080 TaxID=1121449 RepID=A0A1T4WUD6_9BACT|nr:CBS domain-containing protein [Paucidesulfovibrio gracilis]SKA80717.1 CBS domain-containing protein [Paucidesulfovibrio gracilis DSM 16080]